MSLWYHSNHQEQEAVTLWSRAQLSGSNSQKCSEELHRPVMSGESKWCWCWCYDHRVITTYISQDGEQRMQASQSNTIRWVSLRPLSSRFEGHGVAWAVNREGQRGNGINEQRFCPFQRMWGGKGRGDCWRANKEEWNPPKQRLLISMLTAWTKPWLGNWAGVWIPKYREGGVEFLLNKQTSACPNLSSLF